MEKKISASHILCSIEANDDEDALEKINIVKNKLENGEDFSKLAQQFSDCPSGARGGNLGLFTKGQMVEEFDQAAFQLEPGEISGVVKTEFGYHLIFRDS